MQSVPATNSTAPNNPALNAWDLAAPLNALVWLTANSTHTAIAGAGDGKAYLLRPGMHAPLPVDVSEHGAILSLLAHPDGSGAWAGTDTGELVWIAADGTATPLQTFPGQFLEHLAYDAKAKTLAVATGRTVQLLTEQGALKRTTEKHPSTIAGLAVSPSGNRLAVAHYNAVSIWPLDNPKNPPRVLNWKGAHGSLSYSPDAKWLISGMQEQAIHLWRLSDGLDLQMRGYPGKITQFSWSSDGNTLTTNGGDGVPLWNFRDKLRGPAGSQARVLGQSNTEVLVTAVACHPKGPFIAIGYSDGLLLLSNLDQERAVLLKSPPVDTSPSFDHAINTIAWDASGLHLAATTVGGWLGLTDFTQLAV